MLESSARAVGSLRSGDHVCLVYHADEEHAAILSSFVVSGFERNERVFYFADRQSPESVLDMLHARGIDVHRHIDTGRLHVETSAQSYLASGYFDPDECIRGWHATAALALNDGYRGIRVAADMLWSQRAVPGADRLFEYERRIQSEVFSEHPVTGMCEFDARHFKKRALSAFAQLHPDGTVHADPLYEQHSLHILPTFDPFGAHVLGEIDAANLAEFESALQDLRLHAGTDICIDVGGVRFMSAGALSALVRFAKSLSGEHVLIVANMAPRFRRLMDSLDWQSVPGLVHAAGGGVSESALQ